MSFKIAAAAATLALASTVSAHGYVQTLEVGDTFYYNYNTTLQYMSPVPDSIGWSDPEDQDNGYVSDYTSPDIICHKSATNAQLSAPITAGSNVSFTWNTWPDSHHGPVITYLAKCDGNCSTVDKTTLKFFKIDEGGLIEDTGDGGSWASDTLIANDFTWSSQIPSTIASGNYVIRHEIIALHSASSEGGAQNYPQCMNLEITSDGTDEPEGTLGESLYTSTDAGILINIYTSLSTYDIPGPTLYSGGSATSAAGSSATSVASTVASSTAVATSAVATSAVATSAVATSAVSTSSVATSAVATSAVASSSAVVASSAASSAAVKVATTSVASSSAAVVSTSAVVQTSTASDVVVTATATDVVTAQAYTTVTAGATEIASLASQLPSDVLTSTIATSLPTATASGSAAVPTKALPSGTTLEELLQWVEYLLEEITEEEKSSGYSKARRHARDLLVNRK